METKLLSVDQVDVAAKLLLQGELVAFPTETVYGLGARLFDEKAIQKIYIAKGRPQDNPLIAHFSSLKQLEMVVASLPKPFYLLWESLMPGPLTLILPKADRVSLLASAGLGTIGVRCPAHPVAAALLEKVGEPLVAPSANLSGRPSGTRASHVMDDFSGKISAVIEGGSSFFGIESTVLSLVNPKEPKILRPGSIEKEEIEERLGCKVAIGRGGELSASPGTRYRHYAPRVPIRLFASIEECEKRVPLDGKRRFLCLPSLRAGPPWQELSSSSLYGQFRLSESLGDAEIIIVTQGLLPGSALLDRIVRAATS